MTDSDFTGAVLTNFTWVFEATSIATRITLKSRDSAGEDYSDFDTVGLYEVTPGITATGLPSSEGQTDGWSKMVLTAMALLGQIFCDNSHPR